MMEFFSLSMSRNLKEELALAKDKQLWVISNKMVFKQLYHREAKELSCFECIAYIVMWP